MQESTRRWSAVCLSAALLFGLGACAGHSNYANGASVIPQSPNYTDLGDAIAPRAIGPVNIYPGAVIGADNRFAPADGDTVNGGHGKPVGTITCDTTEHVGSYHIHAYLGLIVNGKQVAVPDVVGMVKPGAEDQGYTKTAQCFYWIHTHDASGMIHVEAPKAGVPLTTALYHLSNALDVWGITRNATKFGPFTGTMHAFVGNVPLKTTTVSKYTAFTGSIDNILLHSHTAIWIEIGGNQLPASKLPPVTFYTEY